MNSPLGSRPYVSWQIMPTLTKHKTFITAFHHFQMATSASEDKTACTQQLCLKTWLLSACCLIFGHLCMWLLCTASEWTALSLLWLYMIIHSKPPPWYLPGWMTGHPHFVLLAHKTASKDETACTWQPHLWRSPFDTTRYLLGRARWEMQTLMSSMCTVQLCQKVLIGTQSQQLRLWKCHSPNVLATGSTELSKCYKLVTKGPTSELLSPIADVCQRDLASTYVLCPS